MKKKSGVYFARYFLGSVPVARGRAPLSRPAWGAGEGAKFRRYNMYVCVGVGVGMGVCVCVGVVVSIYIYMYI
jgi:hypothetical protein